MKNLWKLFAVSAFAIVPVTANAAATVEVDTAGVCSKAAADTTSTNMEVLTACNVKKVGDKEVKSISITGALDIDKDITLSVPLTVTGKLTVNATENNARRSVSAKEVTAAGIELKYNTSLTTTGAVSVTTNDIDVKASSALSVTASNDTGAALTAITAGNVNLAKGANLSVSANNKNGNVKDSKNTAIAIAADINVATATAAEKAKVTVTNGDVTGDITVKYTTVSVKDVTGDIDLTNSTLTAGKVTGNVDANASAATATEITLNATAEGENASVNSPKIGGTVEVNGKGAWAQFATAGSTVTVTEGMAKQKMTDSDGKPYTLVKVAEVKNVEGLASNERIVLGTVADAKIVFTKAAKGATITNATGQDIIVSINGKDVTIPADTTDDKNVYVVAEGTETPVDPDVKPEDPDNKPTDPDKVPDVPKTGDTVLVSSALGLVSLIGLAATVKSRKFN